MRALIVSFSHFLWQILHPQVRNNISKNILDRFKHPVTKLVEFIRVHQYVSLELVYIYDSLKVVVCSVWGSVGDIRSESFRPVPFERLKAGPNNVEYLVVLSLSISSDDQSTFRLGSRRRVHQTHQRRRRLLLLFKTISDDPFLRRYEFKLFCLAFQSGSGVECLSGFLNQSCLEDASI
ncbi:hypothetical protein Tco_0596772 [Tanacetum coccineum]